MLTSATAAWVAHAIFWALLTLESWLRQEREWGR